MWYAYILLCEDGSFYTGSSADAEQRFQTHKKGTGGRYTRLHKPIKLVYKEESLHYRWSLVGNSEL
jgi:putative endonuclease